MPGATLTVFPRAAFKAVVAQVANVHPSYVTWKNDPEPAFTPPGASFLWASVRIGSSARHGVGWDNVVRTDNGDGSFKVVQTGRRQIILGFEVFTYTSPLQVFADDVADALASGLLEGSTLAVLNDMGLVIEDIDAILPLPTLINNRMISAAHMDVTVALSVVGTYAYPGGATWIDEVTGTGSIGTEAGGTATQTIDVKSTVHP